MVVNGNIYVALTAGLFFWTHSKAYYVFVTSAHARHTSEPQGELLSTLLAV